MEALGELASAMLGLSTPREKKGRAKRGSADDPEARGDDPVVSEEGRVLLSAPRRVNSKRAQGAKNALDEDDFEEFELDDEDLVTPPPRDANVRPRSRGPSGSREKRTRVDNAMMFHLTPEHRNVIVYTAFVAAQKELEAKCRERFSEKDMSELLSRLRVQIGDHELTWDSVHRRVNRMRDKESFARAPESGRKTTMTPLVQNAAKEVSRLHNGDISGNEMYDQVKAKVGSPAMCGKSTFYRIVRGPKFKRRRVRYRPKLTDQHKKNRVAFATNMLDMDPDVECRIIFVDEKRFEVTGGTLLLAAEDNTPQRAIQSRTNPLFVMALVGVMKPQGHFNGVVGRHAFVDDTFAAKNSKRREKGTLELKAVNVSGLTYLAAWRTLFKDLKRHIAAGQLEAPTAEKPLFFQDDNVKPHQAKVDGRLVGELICEIGLKEFGIHIKPLELR